MKKLLKIIKRKALLALPHRTWNTETIYDALYLVPTGKRHDSGYSLIAIIGVNRSSDGTSGEIAAICDDICWSFPELHPYDHIRSGVHMNIIRTDCMWPSRILRIWASGEHYFKGRFRVGASLSSTDVTLVVEPRDDGKRFRENMEALVAKRKALP